MSSIIYLADIENIRYPNIHDGIVYCINGYWSNYGINKENYVNIDFKHNGCSDAADCILDTILGFLVVKYGFNYRYRIISCDHGFDDTASFYKNMGYDVERID